MIKIIKEKKEKRKEKKKEHNNIMTLKKASCVLGKIVLRKVSAAPYRSQSVTLWKRERR